jgi:hypothetical protein
MARPGVLVPAQAEDPRRLAAYIPRDRHMRKQWLIVAAAATSVALFAFVQAQDTATRASPAEGDGSFQPIAFPHDVHAGQYQMQCMYCHFSADRSVDAGIPPVSACMGCHTAIRGTDERQQQEIARLAEYATRGEAIPWVRIYKVRDHVHFPHMRHVSAGVSCQTCHGQVQEMGVLESQAPEWRGNDMGWCVSCHVESGASRDCTVCHY